MPLTRLGAPSLKNRITRRLDCSATGTAFSSSIPLRSPSAEAVAPSAVSALIALVTVVRLKPRADVLSIATSSTAPEANVTSPTRSPPGPAANFAMKLLIAAFFSVGKTVDGLYGGASEPEVSITSSTSRSRRIASPAAATSTCVWPSTRMNVVGICAVADTDTVQRPLASCTALAVGVEGVEARKLAG